MPKRKNHKNNKPKAKRHTPKEQRANTPKRFGKTRLIETAIALIGLGFAIVGFLALFSNVSVEALKPLKKGDLKSAPIEITNNSYVSIYDISYVCEARELTVGKGGKFIGSSITPKKFINKKSAIELNVKKLSRNESTTIGLPFSFIADKIVSADFEFVLEYRPFLWAPFKTKKPFRFSSSINSDQEIILLKLAVEE